MKGSAFLISSAVAITLVRVAVPASADSTDPLKRSNETTATAAADKSTFVATSTAYVDTDGRVHPVSGGHAGASPYEYKVDRFPGICPDTAAGQPQDLVFIDSRLVADGPNSPWVSGMDPFCATRGAQPLDLGNIASQAAKVTQELQPPAPHARVQPGGTTLVGNPTVFSGSDLGSVQPAALVNPLSGRSLQLTVQPTTWSWDFGDGTPAVTTDGPPPPYVRGGSMAGLLTHTYRRATDLIVTVKVTWTASYTISGIAGVQNVANPVASTTTIRLGVRQARSQLVSR